MVDIINSDIKTLNAYMMVHNKRVATINRSITSDEVISGFAEDIYIQGVIDNIDNGATVDLTASVVNIDLKESELSDPISFLATLREFYSSKNY